MMSDKMYAKILGIALLLVNAHGLPFVQQYHLATSSASFNKHHNTVHHTHSAPTVVKATVAFPVSVTPVAKKALVSQVSAQPQSFFYMTQAAVPFAKLFTPVASYSVPVQYAQHEEEYDPAKYEFAYGVEDHDTGDIHSHKEARDGDVTHGEYSLHEADGTIRTVKYTVDKHSGFKAVVERSGHSIHARPVLYH